MTNQPTPGNRRFYRLHRPVDVSGISGTGFPAEIAVFSDGHAAIHWPGKYPTTTPHPGGLAWTEGIHCHQVGVEVGTAARAFERVVVHLVVVKLEHADPIALFLPAVRLGKELEQIEAADIRRHPDRLRPEHLIELTGVV